MVPDFFNGLLVGIGYPFPVTRLVALAIFFCGGIELLQVPLPTRHARVSDFLVNSVGACFAILCVFVAKQIWGYGREDKK